MATNVSTVEVRLQELLLRVEQAERNNTRLEQKVDNVNRNIITASIIGGAAVGAIAGVAFVACTGCVSDGVSVAKATGIYLAGAAGGCASGAGVGYAAGELLVRTKLGE